MDTTRGIDERAEARADVIPAAPALSVIPSGQAGLSPVGPIVVGVDGSLGVLNAVSWGAAQAARRGANLDLVQVTDAGGEPHGLGRAALHRALGTAAAMAPSVTTTMVKEIGVAGPALVARAARADLLVVGGRRRTDYGPSGDHTVAHLLTHAQCRSL